MPIADEPVGDDEADALFRGLDGLGVIVIAASGGPDSTENSGSLQSGDLPKLTASDVKDRFINGSTPCVFYDFFNEQTIKDEVVRQAIATAINRQAVITALRSVSNKDS